MVAKVAVLLFAVYAMVAVSDVQGAPQFNPFEALTNAGTAMSESVNDAAERASNGFVTTFDEQKYSMDNTIDDVKGVGEKTLDAGANAIKTGFYGFLLPLNFFRNTLAYDRNN